MKSERNQGKHKKVNILCQHIPKVLITQMNEIVYGGTKPLRNKISIPLEKSNRNTNGDRK